MKATQFELAMSDTKIPTFIRNIANRAVKELREGNEKPLEVTEDEFYAICKYSNLTPKKAAYTSFIRIYDELDNGKDIQIHNPFNK